MGLLSKLWKGIKKTVKKIGKGIKKVFGKVMKGIGKLGIVGQIGMMFLMPYAMGAVGSLFGTAGKLASWSSKLLGPNANFFSKVLGKTLEAVNVGGTWIKNAYTSVSTAISNGMDRVGNFFKGKGFTLSEGKASVFSKDFASSLDTLPTQAGIKSDQIQAQLSETVPRALEQSSGTSVFDKDGNYIGVGESTAGQINLPSDFGKTGELTRGMELELNTSELLSGKSKGVFVDGLEGSDLTQGFYNPDELNAYYAGGAKPSPINTVGGVEGLSEQASSLLSPKDKFADQSFFEKINVFDADSKIRDDIRNFDIYNAASEKITSGALSGLESRAYEAVGVDMTPQYTYNRINIPNIMGIGSTPTISLGAIDQFTAPRGNSWQATSMYSSGILNDILNRDGGQDWRNWMNNFAIQNSTSPSTPGTMY